MAGRVGGILFACLVLSTTGLAAQQRDTLRADTTVIRLQGISVSAKRQVRAVGGTSAVEIRIDSIVLAAAPRLDQVLRSVPAIHTRTNSRGEAELTVRGSDARQVAVLVDGVPLTLQWDARTDVSVVPATAVQDLRFTRGLSSVLYGPNVLGGVVEMSVAQGGSVPDRSSIAVGSGIDSYRGHASSATVTIPVATANGSWLIRSGISYRDSPGVPLAGGIVEPVPARNSGLRLNTDTNSRDGFIALRYNGTSGSFFSFSGSGFSAERGVAAELGSSAPRLWRYPNVSRLIAVASGGTGDRDTPFGGRGDLEASIGIDVGRSEIDAYTTRAYDEVAAFEDGEDRTVTLRLLGDHTLGSRADFRSAFTWADIFHRELLPTGTFDYQQRLLSMGGESVYRIVEETGRSVRLSAGAALDVSSTPKTGDKPSLGRVLDWGARIGLNATVNDGNTLLHVGASRRGRFPSLRELYSGSLNRFEPTPELTAEHLVAVEGGATFRIGEAEIQAVAFHQRLSDAIIRITTPERLFKRVNRDQLRSTGIELLASRNFGDIAVGGDLTLQSVQLIDPTSNQSNEPENQPGVFASLNVRLPLVLDLHAGSEVRYTGSQFCLDLDTGEDTRLSGGVQVSADMSRTWQFRSAGGSWLSRLETRIAADNIGDTAIYDQCGLPQPGRLLRFEVRLF